MRSRTMMVLLGLTALLLAIFRPGKEEDRVDVGVTSELVGMWTASGSRYAGRFLEIRPEQLSFGQGADGPVSHRLVGVYLEPAEGGAQTYILAYEAEEESAEPPLELRLSVKDGRLRLANLESVAWRRAP